MKERQAVIRPVFFLAIVAVLVLFAATASSEPRLILGGTAYFESSRLEGEEQVSVQERDQSMDFKNGNFLSARILYLRPQTDNLYVGAGLDFIGTYRANILDSDGEASDPPDYYEFGPLLEAQGMAEWRIPAGDQLTIGLGTQLGLAALFPRGDLAAEIRDLQDQNVGVWNVPRLGWSIGGHTSAIWSLDDRLALRTDFGVQWQSLLLFRTEQTVDDVAFRKHWSTGALRGRIALSLEIAL